MTGQRATSTANPRTDLNYTPRTRAMDLADDLTANHCDEDVVRDQSVEHAHVIMRAMLKGEPIPVHPREGIQVIATSIALSIIADDAKEVVGYVGLDLSRMVRLAKSQITHHR